MRWRRACSAADQFHASYVHSPVRYAWDLQHQYLNEAGLARGPKSAIARALLHYIRNWDARSANGVDRVAANSHFIARRIRKTYRRDATVIYPPVDVDHLSLRPDKEAFYLTASRRAVQADRPDRRRVLAYAGTPPRRDR